MSCCFNNFKNPGSNSDGLWRSGVGNNQTGEVIGPVGLSGYGADTNQIYPDNNSKYVEAVNVPTLGSSNTRVHHLLNENITATPKMAPVPPYENTPVVVPTQGGGARKVNYGLIMIVFVTIGALGGYLITNYFTKLAEKQETISTTSWLILAAALFFLLNCFKMKGITNTPNGILAQIGGAQKKTRRSGNYAMIEEKQFSAKSEEQ